MFVLLGRGRGASGNRRGAKTAAYAAIGSLRPADALSLLAIRRTALGKSVVVVGLLALLALYVTPMARAITEASPVSPLQELKLPAFDLPGLRLPAPVEASSTPQQQSPAHVAGSPAQNAAQQSTLHRRAVRRRTVHLPVVSNTYTTVGNPKPQSKSGPQAPVVE